MMRSTPSAASWAHSRRMTFGRGSASSKSTGGRGGQVGSNRHFRVTDDPASIASTAATMPVPIGPSSRPIRRSSPGARRSTFSTWTARAPVNLARPDGSTSPGSMITRFTASSLRIVRVAPTSSTSMRGVERPERWRSGCRGDGQGAVLWQSPGRPLRRSYRQLHVERHIGASEHGQIPECRLGAGGFAGYRTDCSVDPAAGIGCPGSQKSSCIDGFAVW